MLKCDPQAVARCPDSKGCGDHVFVEGSDCDKFNQQICNKPPTNADRVRGMSNEEMAEMLYSFEDLCMPDYCQSKKECNDMLDADIVIPAENCKRCLVDWLQQPAEEAMT